MDNGWRDVRISRSRLEATPIGQSTLAYGIPETQSQPMINTGTQKELDPSAIAFAFQGFRRFI